MKSTFQRRRNLLMSDFYQTGVVATFHRLGKCDLEKIEDELCRYAEARPIALVLPSLYSELAGEALRGIVRDLQEVKYIKEIVVTLGPASPEEFKKAKEYFSVLPQRTNLIWNSGERIGAVYDAIRKAGLVTGEEGKGRSVWMAFGYILSQQDFHTVAIHDCDILSYNRHLLARLCYPVTNPNLDYDFCKGYYSRVTDRLHGRVTRLLVTPLYGRCRKSSATTPFCSSSTVS